MLTFFLLLGLVVVTLSGTQLVTNISDALRNAMCDEIGTEIDSGAGAGLLEVWAGTAPSTFTTKLATLTFTTPNPYAAAASGVAQEAPIADDTAADATDTAALFKVTTSTPADIYYGTVGTSGQDLNFNSVAFVAGDTVSITDFPNTMPDS